MPDTWYTLKFQTSMEGGEAVLRGKAWIRGEEEPAEWLVEVRDPAPNIEGSPGMSGNAKVAEIFYDNLRIYPNPETALETPATETTPDATSTETDSTTSETEATTPETETEETESSPESETPEATETPETSETPAPDSE